MSIDFDNLVCGETEIGRAVGELLQAFKYMESTRFIAQDSWVAEAEEDYTAAYNRFAALVGEPEIEVFYSRKHS